MEILLIQSLGTPRLHIILPRYNLLFIQRGESKKAKQNLIIRIYPGLLQNIKYIQEGDLILLPPLPNRTGPWWEKLCSLLIASPLFFSVLSCGKCIQSGWWFCISDIVVRSIRGLVISKLESSKVAGDSFTGPTRGFQTRPIFRSSGAGLYIWNLAPLTVQIRKRWVENLLYEESSPWNAVRAIHSSVHGIQYMARIQGRRRYPSERACRQWCESWRHCRDQPMAIKDEIFSREWNDKRRQKKFSIVVHRGQHAAREKRNIFWYKKGRGKCTSYARNQKQRSNKKQYENAKWQMPGAMIWRKGDKIDANCTMNQRKGE